MALINSNNLKQQPIPVVTRQMQIVNGDGTPTRSGQLLLQQLQNVNIVNYGSVADISSITGLPDGALYVDQNGGQVLYQLQNGEWHYVAGTMWGTLNPDQRPKNLGIPDAGFTYRTIDSDPAYGGRTFVWSQSEWVETTLVMYGTHAARPPADEKTMPRTLYVETDRGNVIYQREGTAWVYVAGSMWGTVSPADQRPTDLGANDKGFDFRDSNNAPFQEFIWTGTAWSQISFPLTAANSAQQAFASAAVTLTTVNQPVPGCSLTLARAGSYFISAIFDFAPVNDAGAVLLGSIPGYTPFAVAMVADTGTFRFTVAQNWVIAATAGQVIALQAYKTSGAGSSVVTTQTNITALWVSP
jgi:hypothetical protein